MRPFRGEHHSDIIVQYTLTSILSDLLWYKLIITMHIICILTCTLCVGLHTERERERPQALTCTLGKTLYCVGNYFIDKTFVTAENSVETKTILIAALCLQKLPPEMRTPL